MKYAWAVPLVMIPYGALFPLGAGNPNGDGYAGKDGSTYDSAANPGKTVGTVTYNPMAPMPASATPGPVMPGPANSVPAR